LNNNVSTDFDHHAVGTLINGALSNEIRGEAFRYPAWI
jgi:hypothetical protein